MSARPTPDPVDRNGIDDMYAAYLWALDTGDIDQYIDTFWDDATLNETQLDGSVESWHGADRIRDFSAGHFGQWRGHQHRESTRLYLPDPDGRPDRWTLRSYWFTSHRDAESGDVAFTSTGHSTDVVEKRDGEWRFLVRGIERWPAEVKHPYAG
jgi:ketosteroid isomerase-like protein